MSFLTVPPEVEHTLIWTRIPIYHETIVPPSIKSRIEQDGLWGFTGDSSPPPDPDVHLSSCLPALAEWGITLETMKVSKRGTEEEEALVQRAGSAVHEFVRRRWNETAWETAWFVNPPVSMMVFPLFDSEDLRFYRGCRVFQDLHISMCLLSRKLQSQSEPCLLLYEHRDSSTSEVFFMVFSATALE